MTPAHDGSEIGDARYVKGLGRNQQKYLRIFEYIVVHDLHAKASIIITLAVGKVLGLVRCAVGIEGVGGVVVRCPALKGWISVCPLY